MLKEVYEKTKPIPQDHRDKKAVMMRRLGDYKSNKASYATGRKKSKERAIERRLNGGV